MKRTIILFEDDRVEQLEPLSLSHASWDLLAGTGTLAQKIAGLYPRSQIKLTCRNSIACLYQNSLTQLPAGNYLFVNGRVLDTEALASAVGLDGGDQVYLNAQTIVAARVSIKQKIESGIFSTLKEKTKGLKQTSVNVPLANYLWDYISANARLIESEAKNFEMTIQGQVHPSAILLNKKNIALGKNSTIAPAAVLDATNGPIVIETNVCVLALSVIYGPVFIGPGATINAQAQIKPGTSIGQGCKVGGEVGASIIMPFSNKQHLGVLEHSFVGSWVNLGGATTTSDLKNTYGTVKVQVGPKCLDTNRQFVGSFIGDHVKTGIGTLLTTGSTIGPFTNIFGTGPIEKHIPAFTWLNAAGKAERYHFDQAMTVAARVMLRRDQKLTKAMIKAYRQLFDA